MSDPNPTTSSTSTTTATSLSASTGSTLSHDLCLSRGVGGFVLGMPLLPAMQLLRHSYAHTPRVDLLFDEARSTTVDVVLHLRRNGMLLRFDAACQQLKAIEIYDFAAFPLTEGNLRFFADNKPAAFDAVYHHFSVGRAAYDDKIGSYTLVYAGLCLFFDVPKAFQAGFKKGDHDLTRDLVWPDGKTPRISRAIVFAGTDWQNPAVEPGAAAIKDEQLQQSLKTYMEPVVGHPGVGLVFPLRRVSLSFGDSAQDVISCLGPPDDVFYKDDRRLRRRRERAVPEEPVDVFLNYFRHGIDVLIDGSAKTVKKFLLHANVPGHYNFTRYARCNFSIKLHSDSIGSVVEQFFEASDHDWGSGLAEGVVDQQPQRLDLEDALQVVDLNDEMAFGGSAAASSSSAAPVATAATLTAAGVAAHPASAGRPAAPSGKPLPPLSPGIAIPPGASPTATSSSPTSHVITPATNWSTVREWLGAKCSEPIVLNRPPSPNATNPFRATLLFGLRSLIVEVTQTTNHVATVCLLAPPAPSPS